MDTDSDSLSALDEFLQRAEGGVVDLLGIRIEQLTRERTVLTMEHRRDLSMPYGVLHGGIVATLADTAAGLAMVADLEPGQAFATVELELKLLGAVREGTVTAVATPVHRGRTTAVYEVTVTGPDDRPVARFSCTQMILDRLRR